MSNAWWSSPDLLPRMMAAIAATIAIIIWEDCLLMAGEPASHLFLHLAFRISRLHPQCDLPHTLAIVFRQPSYSCMSFSDELRCECVLYSGGRLGLDGLPLQYTHVCCDDCAGSLGWASNERVDAPSAGSRGALGDVCDFLLVDITGIWRDGRRW